MDKIVKAILAECGVVTRQFEHGFGLTFRAVHGSDHTSVTRVIANGQCLGANASCETMDVMMAAMHHAGAHVARTPEK